VTVTPRDYQVDVVDRVRSKVQAGARRVILQGATGSGKTTCSSMIVRAAVEKGSRVLFLAHRRRLIEQKSQRLDQFGIPHSVLMSGYGRSFLPVTVASRDTLFSRSVRNDWIEPPPADLVILDECHNSPEQYQTLLAAYPKAVVVGLTATPTRGDGTGLGGYFDALVCTVPVSKLVADGYLCPVTCYAPRGQAEGKRVLHGDPVYHWKKYADGRPTILFAATVEASKAAAAAFVADGVPAAHLDAHSTDAERDAVVASVEAGRVMVLCNVGLYTEGVDIPCLSCCILLRMASSYVVFCQATGRIMRPHPGKDRGILIDHAGAIVEHGFPDEDVEWSLDESESVDDRVKKDKKDGKRKEPICCARCALVYSGVLQCPGCGYVPLVKPKAQPKKDSLLFEVPRDLALNRGHEERERYWTKCLAVMAHRNGTCGAAAQMFRKKYPEGPEFTFRHYPASSQWRERVADVYPQFAGRRRA
jgi:DNA repair protein RadD